MDYQRLGRSALQVSKLCLGTMNFGPRTIEKDSFAILDCAVAAGINLIDTANQYGGSCGVGATEEIIGKWFAQNPSKRNELVLATKVHEPMSDNINDRGLSARHIQMACDASLKRLGVDHIDLYQMHHIDRAAPIEEIWQAMDRLIQQGKITYVGSSNFPGWGIAQANEKAIAKGQLGLIAEQGLYNLVERRAEMEVIPACLEYGLSLIPWSPLAGGLLAGASTDGATEQGRRKDALSQASPKRVSQLQQFDVLCESLGHSPSNVALAWLLSQPVVASVITGPSSVQQLEAMLVVPELVLSEETLTQLDVIFPASGPSPEAYAW